MVDPGTGRRNPDCHLRGQAAPEHQPGLPLTIPGVGRASDGLVAGGIRDQQLTVEFCATPGQVHHGPEGSQVTAWRA
jgi:hypothetical protein